MKATVNNGVVWKKTILWSSVLGRIHDGVLRDDGVFSPHVLARLDGKMIKRDVFLGEFIAHIEGNIIYKGAGSGGTILGRFDGPDEVALAIYFFL